MKREEGGFIVWEHIRTQGLFPPCENVDGGDAIQAGISLLEAIDMRHREKFRYYDSGYPFEYEIVRGIFAKRRELYTMK
jgi:hypothetical protein